MSINVRFSAKDWARIKRDWSAWWAQELDRPMVVINAMEFEGDGHFTIQGFEGWDEEKGEFPVECVLDHYQRMLERETYYADSWPRWWPNFGPGIVAGFLGARVQHDTRTVWFEPANDGRLQALRPAYDGENFWWSWAQAITRAAVERWGSQVTVAHTDLGGNLDILASLRTTEGLLLDHYDAPEEIERLVPAISGLWRQYYDALTEIILPAGAGITAWTPLWCADKYYMLQSDFSYMISPAMFERFVMPDLEACCNHLDHAFYHLDGKGQIPHLDMLLSIERLRGIQWIPGDGQPPTEAWLPLLKRIRGAGKLVNVYARPEGALEIVREIGGEGFAFWITDGMPEEEVDGFLRQLAIQDISQ